MIEEFQDYLVRHGVAGDLAEEMHDAAYVSVQELRKLGISGEFDSDEMVAMYREWQREVGELNKDGSYVD